MSVETRPLTSHTTGDTLAWDESGSVTVDAFYRSAVRMAQSLPPSQYVVNTCQDRYLFMLGFAAALISGRPTLMPSSFTEKGSLPNWTITRPLEYFRPWVE